ncbi:MAG TPA: ArsB/NhaD family transporter [Anaerolineales bacterium]|nr:ArsB/NhaD family transporter [Anaerolineales bacterium]
MGNVAILSSLIFVVSLILIFTEKVNRTIVAFAGAFLMVGVEEAFHVYNLQSAIESIDFETLGLLMGMMIIVAMLEPTGFIEYLAVLAARASRGKPVRLFILLGAVTTVLSMFLDNVTTVVLIAPVTLLISEILGVSAIPYLVAEALLSNTGGVATLVGDPPNVLIGSAAGLSFNDFLIYSLPIVAVTWFGALFFLRFLFRKELGEEPHNAKAVMKLNPAQTLNDPENAKKILIVLGAAIALFFVHHIFHIEPAFVALGAAAVALFWVQPDIHETLGKVEWSVLVFFGALFVMVGGLEKAGVLETILGLFRGASGINPVLFGVAIIWIVAILSAVVDNIPITIALIPVIQGLGASGMDIAPLWWALAFGAGFGGNGTIIGSTANIIVVTLSEKTRKPITAMFWMKRGLPVMILACSIASVLYIIFFSAF